MVWTCHVTAEKFGKAWGFASIVITIVVVVFRPKKFSKHLSLRLLTAMRGWSGELLRSFLWQNPTRENKVGVAIRTPLGASDRKSNPNWLETKENALAHVSEKSKGWVGFGQEWIRDLPLPTSTSASWGNLLPQLSGVPWQPKAQVYITHWPTDESKPKRRTETDWPRLTSVLCTCLNQSLQPEGWSALTGLDKITCLSLGKSFTKACGLREVKWEPHPVKPGEVDVGR